MKKMNRLLNIIIIIVIIIFINDYSNEISSG